MRDDVRALVDELAAAWNRGAWRSMAGLFEQDADYVTGAGILLRGRARIERYFSEAAAAAPSPPEPVSIDEVTVRKLAPEAASCLVRWSMERHGRAGRGGWFTLVLRREAGAWRIATLHNTDYSSATSFTDT